MEAGQGINLEGTGHWWPLVYLGMFDQVFSAPLNCLPFSHSVMSDSLWSRGLQHNRLRYPSLSPGVCSDLCILSWWCHPTISSSVAPFSSCPQCFPASGSFPASSRIASWVFCPIPSKGVDRRHSHWFVINQIFHNIPQAKTARKSNQSILKEINPEYSLEGLMLKLKLPSTWPLDVNSQPTGKEIDVGKDWGQKEMGVTECEMVGWHHWLKEHEFSVPDYPGDTERQGSLACCSPWGCKESYMAE